jgi:hypothetical protein
MSLLHLLSLHCLFTFIYFYYFFYLQSLIRKLVLDNHMVDTYFPGLLEEKEKRQLKANYLRDQYKPSSHPCGENELATHSALGVPIGGYTRSCCHHSSAVNIALAYHLFGAPFVSLRL